MIRPKLIGLEIPESKARLDGFNEGAQDGKCDQDDARFDTFI